MAGTSLRKADGIPVSIVSSDSLDSCQSKGGNKAESLGSCSVAKDTRNRTVRFVLSVGTLEARTSASSSHLFRRSTGKGDTVRTDVGIVPSKRSRNECGRDSTGTSHVFRQT